jgi:uncharacterized membrane protein
MVNYVFVLAFGIGIVAGLRSLTAPAPLLGQPLALGSVRSQTSASLARTTARAANMFLYDETGNVIETHQHAGQFKEW